MKIGMIAMSGIRAANPDLVAAGLEMPGVVERAKIVASLPSLSLLTLAGMTPDDIDIAYHEIADLRAEGAPPGDFDLVVIATYSAQVLDAYELADGFRARGVPVVMGGLHVKAEPEEAAQHATTIAVGEGEKLWPDILRDFQRGELKPRYDQIDGDWFDLADAPMPRFDLLNMDRYNRLTVQTSRGCPHLCDFCASSVLLTPKYRVKPVSMVIDEIRQIKKHWARPFIEFADDNSFISRSHAKDLMRAIAPEEISWFTETDISIADDPELLDLMRISGCRQVLIGLESPTPDGLDGLELRRNWKLKVQPDYAGAIARIQSHGVTVNACFILGLDGHTPRTFDAVYDFVEEVAPYDAQITVLTPFPGTALYKRLEQEGRLLEPRAWNKCTLFDVNFEPRGMTPDELQWGLVALARRLYAPEAVQRRREKFFEQSRNARRSG